MKSQKTVLLGHSYWGRGGAEIAAMWVIQALVEKYRVHVLTRGGWDLESLNAVSGTAIRPGEVSIRTVSNLPGGFAAIAHGAFQRTARTIGPEFDVCITASGCIDWGCRAIHFLSSVTWNDTLRERFQSADAPSRRGMPQRAVWALSRIAAGCSRPLGGPDDWFVANSNWTATQSAEFCESPVRIIYPPVVSPTADLRPWEAREDAVVCLGRISPEKEIERVVLIVEELRRAGHALTLYLVGEIGQDAYGQTVLKICQDRREWMRLCGGLYGLEKHALLTRCKYGVSACTVEAFGIATAEMSAAGMVVFVPAQGGQAEIVTNGVQQYSSNANAVTAIAKVLSSRDLQLALQSDAIRAAQNFAPERFVGEVASLVDDFIDAR